MQTFRKALSFFALAWLLNVALVTATDDEKPAPNGAKDATVTEVSQAGAEKSLFGTVVTRVVSYLNVLNPLNYVGKSTDNPEEQTIIDPEAAGYKGDPTQPRPISRIQTILGWAGAAAIVAMPETTDASLSENQMSAMNSSIVDAQLQHEGTQAYPIATADPYTHDAVAAILGNWHHTNPIPEHQPREVNPVMAKRLDQEHAKATNYNPSCHPMDAPENREEDVPKGVWRKKEEKGSIREAAQRIQIGDEVTLEGETVTVKEISSCGCNIDGLKLQTMVYANSKGETKVDYVHNGQIMRAQKGNVICTPWGDFEVTGTTPGKHFQKVRGIFKTGKYKGKAYEECRLGLAGAFEGCKPEYKATLIKFWEYVKENPGFATTLTGAFILLTQNCRCRCPNRPTQQYNGPIRHFYGPRYENHSDTSNKLF